MKGIIVWTIAASAVSTTSASLCTGIAPYSYSVAAQFGQFHTALTQLKKHPVATWYTDKGGDAIDALLAACPNDPPVIVLYGLPGKDCASGFSSTGANKNAGDYKNWVQSLASRVGNRNVIYVLEPDAVGLLANLHQCAKDQGYQANLATAVQLLSANPNAKVYADVASWALRGNAVTVLKSLGKLKGIAINTSNYKSTSEMKAVCQQYSDATGGLHCIIDTSRNFNGSPQNEWCNAQSAGIGAPPTDSTGSNIVDYYVWVKVPGESDGQCTYPGHTSDAGAGPDAGQFFADGFSRLWDQGHFVANGAPRINAQAPSQAPGPAPNDQCNFKPNWDYYGNDLYSFGVSGDIAAQAASCCNACKGDNKCNAFTIWSSTCFIKSSTGNGGRVCDTCVTGAKGGPAPNGQCNFRPNWDYFGNDLYNVKVSGDQTTQAAACCSVCEKDNNCKAFTVWGSTCFIKSSTGNGGHACNTCVTGTKCTTGGRCSPVQANLDYWGNDITRFPVATGDVASQVEDCCGKCTSTNGCAGYTINDGFCYIKSSVDKPMWSPTAMSGRRA